MSASVNAPSSGHLTSARRYADQGIFVFPVRVSFINGDKKLSPIADWRNQSTTDSITIAHWWGAGGKYQNYSIAMDCGKSGKVVVDPDGQEGLANWAEFCAKHNLSNTYRSQTPGGGQHWFYNANPERDVRNTAGDPSKTNARYIAVRVDTRGVGGFVILPPSIDERGRYSWIEGEPNWKTLPVVPDAVIDAVTKPRESTQEGSADQDPDAVRVFSYDEAVAFVKPYMTDLKEATKGGRNHALNKAAKVISHFVPEFWSRELVETWLMFYLDSDYPEDEAAATIESAFKSAVEDWKATKRSGPAVLSRAGLATFEDEVASVSRVQLPGLPEEFWSARPVLNHIRQAAWARVQIPDAVFYSVLVRLSALMDYRIKVDSGIGGPASLNFYAGIVGESGAGKSGSVHVANELMPAPEDLDFEGALPLGSGEGIAEVYMGMGDPPGPAIIGKEKPKPIKTQVRHNALFYVDEGQTLMKLLFERSGMTTGATLRSGWNGALLGARNAQEVTTRIVKDGTYSLGLIVAMQPSVVVQLLEDGGTGMPQRFCWSTAADPNIPDERVEWPGPLRWDSAGIRRPRTIHLADHLKDTLYRKNIARKRGEASAMLSEMNGQQPLMLVKLSALLALLASRSRVEQEDWDLAEMVWKTSCRVRDTLVEFSAASRQRDAQARSDMYLERRLKETVAISAVPQNIERVAALVEKWCAASEVPLDRNTMRKSKVSSRDRVFLDSAIELALDKGWIANGPDGGFVVPPPRPPES